MTQARSPEPLPVDKVECARCRMLISTEAGGGEIVSSSDETRFYDDVGCLAADWKTHGADAIAFVRLSSGRWSDAQHAVFVRSPDVRTPMGSGFIAFATAAEARASEPDRQALTFDEVVTAIGATR